MAAVQPGDEAAAARAVRYAFAAEQIRTEGVCTWDYHPRVLVRRALAAAPVSWVADLRAAVKFSATLDLRDLRERCAEGCELHIAPLRAAPAGGGALRFVQWHSECLVLWDGAPLSFAPRPSAPWWATVPAGGDSGAHNVAYFDRAAKDRVTHDPVPSVAWVALLECEPPVDAGPAAGRLLSVLPRLYWQPAQEWRVGGSEEPVEEFECVHRRDPSSCQKIRHAVRPRGCAHAQCVDLETLVSLFDMRMARGLRCPVCDNAFSMRDLVSCRSFEAFLADQKRDVPRKGWHVSQVEYVRLYGPPPPLRGFPVLSAHPAAERQRCTLGRALTARSAVALLHPGGATHTRRNAFVLAVVAGPPSTGEEGYVRLAGLRQCCALPSLWLPTAEEWDEPLACLAPVEAVWLALPGLGEGECLELREQEPLRLQQIALG